MVRCIAIGLVIATLGGAVAADDGRTGPQMAVASNFGQGFLPDLMDQALALGITDFRDAVYWDRVEGADGNFTFVTPETTYPDLLTAGGAGMSLTVNNGHPAYDAGATPVSPEAVAAFATHAAETLRRFPAIDAIEVGNEFNSANFVSGPLGEADLDARAAGYVALLEAVATRARMADPDVRMIGGGVHSIPTGYLAKLLELGAADHMDTIALHPYSTPVEHYAKQIAVMRRLPGLADIPIEITEFGSESADLAPGKMLRSHCQYGLAGATRLAWYALNVRGDGFAPLITPEGQVTRAGETFQFIEEQLAGTDLQDVSPDPFTYACLYDQRTLVIWGMPRAVTITSDAVVARDPTGALLDTDSLTLSETAPLVLTSATPMALGQDVVLADQPVLADSYHGFTYPEAAEAAQANGGFLRQVRSGGVVEPMHTMPGQDRPGRPWTPWLGLPTNGDVRLLPETLLPAGNADYAVDILHSYTADTAEDVVLSLMLAPSDHSTDGVTLTVTVGDQAVFTWSGTTKLTETLPPVTLAAGQSLQIAVGPGETSAGDITDYRFILTRAE